MKNSVLKAIDKNTQESIYIVLDNQNKTIDVLTLNDLENKYTNYELLKNPMIYNSKQFNIIKNMNNILKHG